MTTQWDYWNGPDTVDRRTAYAKVFLPEYQANGDDAQRRINAVATAFYGETSLALPDGYASGWRPPGVNEATSNAGKASRHLTAQAGDKRDTLDGAFAWWCLRTQWVLEVHGLYQEHPAATVLRSWKLAAAERRAPTPWAHLQSVPPGSGHRVYWPDANAEPEWEAFLAAGGAAGLTFAAWQALQRPLSDAISLKTALR